MENQYQVEAEARYEYTEPSTGERRVHHVPQEVDQW